MVCYINVKATWIGYLLPLPLKKKIKAPRLKLPSNICPLILWRLKKTSSNEVTLCIKTLRVFHNGLDDSTTERL